MSSRDSMVPSLSGGFASAAATRLLVLGDVMLDRAIVGDAERTSPEAPVVILRAERTESHPGGAAAVAHLLQGLELGDEIKIAGVVGADAAASELEAHLTGVRVSTAGLVADPSRPTTVKERFIGQAAGRHSQQVLRVDHESTADIGAEALHKLWSLIADQIPDCDVVLISDYAKGVCTPELLQRVMASCRKHDVPVVIDPARRHDVSRYAGADLIKPNRAWLERVMNRPIADVSAARDALKQLRHTLGWRTERLLLTLDQDGMLLDEPGREPVPLPAAIRQVYDVTGAGDMAQAMLGACLARGFDWAEAAEWAITAAGLEVERRGAAPVSWREIETAHHTGLGSTSKIVRRETVAERLRTARQQGHAVVFTNGCFDLLHAGHVRLLQQAANLGDLLVVAINSDASVKRMKGISRPIIPQEQRAELLAALACVDLVMIFDDDTPIPLLKALRPDILVKGAEYSHEEVVGWEVVTSYGGRIVTVPMVAGLSTTHVANACRRQGDEEKPYSMSSRLVECPSPDNLPILS